MFEVGSSLFEFYFILNFILWFISRFFTNVFFQNSTIYAILEVFNKHILCQMDGCNLLVVLD